MDTGLKVEGLRALALWNIVIDVLKHPANRTEGYFSRQFKPKTFKTVKEFVDHVPPNAPEIVMMKGQIPTLASCIENASCHLDWLLEKVNSGSTTSEKCSHLPTDRTK